MPCVNRKTSGNRAVFTVPPPPPVPGQLIYDHEGAAAGDLQGQEPGKPQPPAATSTTVLPSGNIGGPHGPNLGVPPHRQAQQAADAGLQPTDPHAGSGSSSSSSRAGGHARQASSPHQQHQLAAKAASGALVCPQHLELVSTVPQAPKCLDPGLQSYWCSLSLQQRRQMLRLSKKDLFTRVRSLYCSGCFALVQLQYEDLCTYVADQAAAASAAKNGSSSLSGGQRSCAICASGHACFSGLWVLEDGSVTLTDDLLSAHPFGRFEQARDWDLEREQHFSSAEVCGSGWCKRPGVNKCKLHTGPVAPDELLAYWATLPQQRREALMTLDEETFLGELDVSMKLQLRICKECRSNVTRAFKELKPGRDAAATTVAAGAAAPAANGAPPAPPPGPTGLLLCDRHELRASDGRVRVEGPGEACLFEKAEEVQEQKVREGRTRARYHGVTNIKSAGASDSRAR